MEMQTALVEAEPFIERIVHMFRERAVRHAIGLTYEVDPRVDSLYMDERKVKQLLYNLLSNALKFTPDGGAVGVKVEPAEHGIRLSVVDTGVGIPKAEQERIFETFYQVDSTLTKTKQGTGLGLALVTKIAEMHGGRVWVESEPGRGSTFVLELPNQGTAAGLDAAGSPITVHLPEPQPSFAIAD